MRRRHLAGVFVVGVLAALAGSAGTAKAHIPFCLESVNPHGQTIPPAGNTTLPGPKGGQNEDGFYRIGTNVGTSVRSAATSSIRGPSAASTRGMASAAVGAR